jgi:hypothetical protein
VESEADEFYGGMYRDVFNGFLASLPDTISQVEIVGRKKSCKGCGAGAVGCILYAFLFRVVSSMCESSSAVCHINRIRRLSKTPIPRCRLNLRYLLQNPLVLKHTP